MDTGGEEEGMMMMMMMMMMMGAGIGEGIVREEEGIVRGVGTGHDGIRGRGCRPM